MMMSFWIVYDFGVYTVQNSSFFSVREHRNHKRNRKKRREREMSSSKEEPLLGKKEDENVQTNKIWTAGLKFFRSSRSDSSSSLNEGKIVKQQSWLVPEVATRVPILDQNRDDSITEETLMRRITSSDIGSRSSGSPLFTKRKKQNSEESKIGTTYDENRFILDSLRLEFVNDRKLERLFRERFFSIQTGHRHWTAFWQAVGEMFTNMTVSLISIEIVILIHKFVVFAKTDESKVPYLHRVSNCSSSSSSSNTMMNEECFLVRYFDSVYEICHGTWNHRVFVVRSDLNRKSKTSSCHHASSWCNVMAVPRSVDSYKLCVCLYLGTLRSLSKAGSLV